jgi:hypothetical protein
MNEPERTPPEKTYLAIGRFMFEFSQAEYTIRHYLGDEIDLNEKHFTAVVESYDVRTLCAVAKAVFTKTRSTEDAARIEELINNFDQLNTNRNRVAHGLWVPSNEGGTVHYVPRRSLIPRSATDQAEALEKLADEACKLCDDLHKAFIG